MSCRAGSGRVCCRACLAGDINGSVWILESMRYISFYYKIKSFYVNIKYKYFDT